VFDIIYLVEYFAGIIRRATVRRMVLISASRRGIHFLAQHLVVVLDGIAVIIQSRLATDLCPLRNPGTSLGGLWLGLLFSEELEISIDPSVNL